jgi:hypothetical protein
MFFLFEAHRIGWNTELSLLMRQLQAQEVAAELAVA